MRSCGSYAHCFGEDGQCYDCWTFEPQVMLGKSRDWLEARYKKSHVSYQTRWEESPTMIKTVLYWTNLTFTLSDGIIAKISNG